jgi:two-component system, response regulator / RNA-binding antiterminator
MDPSLGRSATFVADPTPKLVVDRDYVIQAVNPAFCRATGRQRDELLSLGVFEAFPANPHDPRADGTKNAMASFERVLRTGSTHNMMIQRYDIPDPHRSGKFLRRHWIPVNSPLRHNHEVVGILIQVSDVTLLREDILTAMQYYRALLTANDLDHEEDDQHDRMVDALTEGIRHFNDLADEVTQLQQALNSRAIIEQAKGMLMMSRRCGPDEAFDLLRQASRNNNVRLAKVASLLTQQLRA